MIPAAYAHLPVGDRRELESLDAGIEGHLRDAETMRLAGQHDRAAAHAVSAVYLSGAALRLVRAADRAEREKGRAA